MIVCVGPMYFEFPSSRSLRIIKRVQLCNLMYIYKYKYIFGGVCSPCRRNDTRSNSVHDHDVRQSNVDCHTVGVHTMIMYTAVRGVNNRAYMFKPVIMVMFL